MTVSRSVGAKVGLVLAAIATATTAMYSMASDYAFLRDTKLVGIRCDGLDVKYLYEARASDHARAIAEDARQEIGYKTGWKYAFQDDCGTFSNARSGETIRFSSDFMGNGYQTNVEISRRATLSERIRAWLLGFIKVEPRSEW
jgi:hypothetical protein